MVISPLHFRAVWPVLLKACALLNKGTKCVISWRSWLISRVGQICTAQCVHTALPRALLKHPLPCTFGPSLCACAQENTRDRHVLLMWGRCDVRVVKPEITLLLCLQSCAANTGKMDFVQGCLLAQGTHSMPLPWLHRGEGRGAVGTGGTASGGGAAVEQCCKSEC